MCQTLESMSMFAYACVTPTVSAVIVCLEMCVFVLTYARNGYVGMHVGLHVCFSQPSQR